MEDYRTMDRKTVMHKLQQHEKYRDVSQKVIATSVGGIKELRNELENLDAIVKHNTHFKNKYISALQKTKTYLGWNADDIYENLGSNLKNLELAVEKNKQSYNTFEHFEQLPEDVQSSILKLNQNTLRHSPVISQTLRRSTPVMYSYYNEFCNLPLGEEEVVNYVYSYEPDTILFYIPSNNEVIKYRRTYNGKKSLLYTSEEIVYNTSNYPYVRNNNIPLLFRGQYTNVIDVKNTYRIYKSRLCDRITSGYSKIKTKEALSQLYNNANNNSDEINNIPNYKHLYILFTYLRLSLKMFDMKVPKNIYHDYHVAGNVNGVFGKDNLTGIEVIELLKDDCKDMYEQLIDIVDHLN